MTEKRFIVAICGDGKLGIRDLTTLNEYTSERQVADYMNRITNENEQFKNLARDYNIPFDKLCETFESCLDENEQLKSQREDLKRALSEKDKEIMKLRRENNQMKRYLND